MNGQSVIVPEWSVHCGGNKKGGEEVGLNE